MYDFIRTAGRTRTRNTWVWKPVLYQLSYSRTPSLPQPATRHTSPMASFIGTAGYMYAKQGCYRCGRNDHLVDTDIHIESEGHQALCRDCIGDLGVAASLLFNKTYVSELQARIVEAEAAKLAAEARLARLTDVLSDDYSGPTSTARRDKNGRFVKA